MTTLNGNGSYRIAEPIETTRTFDTRTAQIEQRMAKIAERHVAVLRDATVDYVSANADFVKRIPEVAFDRIMLQIKVNDAVKHINGWICDAKTGIYRTDYLNRALVTAVGLGANLLRTQSIPSPKRTTTVTTMMERTNTSCTFPRGNYRPLTVFGR